MLRKLTSVLSALWPLLLYGAETPPPAETVPPAWRTFVAATKPVHSVQWTPDERHVIATSFDGWCRVWSVETGRVVNEFRVDGALAAMMPDGEHVVIACNSRNQLTLYQWATGKVIRQFSKPRDTELRSLCVSAKGDRIASGEEKTGSFTVWDAVTGKILQSFTGHTGAVNAVCFTPDGHRLVSGGNDKVRILWDIDTGKESARWSTPEFFVSCLEISSDGRYLVESGGSNAAIVRELATQQVVQTLRGHEDGWIMCCRFLKDLPLIATSCSDKTVRVWDVGDGRNLLTIRGLKHYQFGLSFSPSGTLLAAGSGGDQRDGKWWVGEDFGVRLWKLPKTIWRRRTGPITLAVLGFETTGTSPAQARLRETLVDGLVQTLSDRRDLRLVERNSAAFLRAEQGLRSGFTQETAPLANVESAEVLLSGTLGETNGRVDITVRLHVIGRAEPIAQWSASGTADKFDDMRAKLIDRTAQELELQPVAVDTTASASTTTITARLAVLPLRNQTGNPKRDDWAEGLADLLNVKLGQLDTIALVERQALQAVLQEQQLQAARSTDPATAIRLGQLAGADWVLVGSLSGEGEKLMLSVRIVDVATSRILTGREQAIAVAQIDQGLAEAVAGLQQDLFPNAPPAAKPKSPDPAISTHSLEHASLMARARRLFVEKKTTEAATAYEQALLLQDSSVEARLELLRCHADLQQWEHLLEVAQKLRDRPAYKNTAAYVRYEVARAEIDALARLKRTEEIRRRGSGWEQESGPFKADIARAWKRAAGIRDVETADSLQFATEVRKHGHRSEPLRKLYINAFLRLRKGSVDKQLAACQDVVVVVDHVLKICGDKRDADAQRWARTLIPNALEMLTYYEMPDVEQTPFLTVDQKIERLEHAWRVFGWMPSVQYEILAKLSYEQRLSGRYDAASETYLKLARAPIPEPDRLPLSLDRREIDPTTILDRRINGWAGWARMRAIVAPESARSALETALAEIGAVHERGPELIAAASEANVALRWPERLALIWGGGHSTWQSWQNVLRPLGLRAHPVRRIGVTSADLEPYELVVLVRSGPIAFLPGEILALRNHVARGGRLLVVLSPGWDAAQPAVHRTLLDLFGIQPGVPTEVRALSTKLADHPVTRGLTGVLAKCAVSIQAPPEAQLVVSGDRCLLAASEYRTGRIAVASFGQWFVPDASVYGNQWINSVGSEVLAMRRPEDLPIAIGVDAQRPLLDQLLKWMLSPVESPTPQWIDATAWRTAAAAIREVQARAMPPGELPAILERLVSQAVPGSVEREEALWFAGEASQAFQYHSTAYNSIAWAEQQLHSGLDPKVYWPAQPEYYDQLASEFPSSPLLGLAQFRKADALRRCNASDHARGEWLGDDPYPPIIQALEKVESKPGHPAWAWQQLRLGRLRQLVKPNSNAGLANFQAVADLMAPSPEKGLAVQAVAMIELELGHRAEAQRALELLLSDIPDYYYGGPSSADWYEKWKPLNDTFQNHPSRRQTISINLRDLAQQQLQRMQAKK